MESNDTLHRPYDSPLRPDAFVLDDKTKIALIENHFREIMQILGLDLEDPSINKTPHRVAKMYVREIFSGLNPCNKPKISLFDDNFNYGKMIIERDITVHSNCEHHFVPFMGKAHVGYFSNGKVIGLSKINRIVNYYSRRPQLQERLTLQIVHELMESIGTEDAAVLIKAKHMCVASRGIQDDSTNTITGSYFGKFLLPEVKSEFFKLVGEI
jgi:GTP cyclohydrolase I